MIVKLQFKFKNFATKEILNFKDTFLMEGNLQEEVEEQLKYERQFTEGNILPSSIKVNSKKFVVKEEIMAYNINSIRGNIGLATWPSQN